MQVSVSDAKGQLTDLVRRAEAGDVIILTRHGQAAVQLVPVGKKPTSADRRRILESVRMAGREKAAAGPNAARSQDFLYNDNGLPK